MIDTRITIDLKLNEFSLDTKRKLVKGVSRASGVIADRAKSEHHTKSTSKERKKAAKKKTTMLRAHDFGRYENVTGALTRSIKIMPTTILGNEIHGGAIAMKEYAAPVDQGHDIKRGGKVVGHAPPYPFLSEAVENKDVEKEVIKIIADSVK